MKSCKLSCVVVEVKLTAVQYSLCSITSIKLGHFSNFDKVSPKHNWLRICMVLMSALTYWRYLEIFTLQLNSQLLGCVNNFPCSLPDKLNVDKTSWRPPIGSIQFYSNGPYKLLRIFAESVAHCACNMPFRYQDTRIRLVCNVFIILDILKYKKYYQNCLFLNTDQLNLLNFVKYHLNLLDGTSEQAVVPH